MNAETKSFILQCIERARGDDLVRAQMAFHNCSPDMLKKEYGESGRTRQEILDGHEAHNQQCNEAIEAIK